MQCPVDQTVLQMSERQGVEIDYCPTCRGVWLDRGELDKIIDRADAVTVQPQDPAGQGYVAQPYPTQEYDNRGYDRDRDNRGYSDRGHDNRGHDNRGYDDRRGDPRYRKKKKEGFLGELFDF
jgi:Zn-finger nucleic acid-binding protein